jgi:micrococcal nuclease
MDTKEITNFNAQIVVFTILLGICVLSPQYAEVSAQKNGTTTVPVAKFNGVVTKVVDGDTLDVRTNNGNIMTVRLALVDAPETHEPGYIQAKSFVTQKCLNRTAAVDPDNNQGLTFGRLVAVVYCGGLNINEAAISNGFAAIYQSFCEVSEFANTVWAQKFGCGNVHTADSSGDSPSPENGDKSGDCDSSYPSVCIPPAPPDLDCGDIWHKNFKVISPDPHRFDRDGDGRGCDS